MSDPRQTYITAAAGPCAVCGADGVAHLTSLDGSEPDRIVCAEHVGPAERLILSPAWVSQFCGTSSHQIHLESRSNTRHEMSASEKRTWLDSKRVKSTASECRRKAHSVWSEPSAYSHKGE